MASVEQFPYTPFAQLDLEQQESLQIARSLLPKVRLIPGMKRIRVAAVVRTNTGERYVGINVPITGQTAGLCAERNALSTAYAMQEVGTGWRNCVEIAIVGRDEDNGGKPFFPCGGGCLQWLQDWAVEARAEPLIVTATYDFEKVIVVTLGQVWHPSARYQYFDPQNFQAS